MRQPVEKPGMPVRLDLEVRETVIGAGLAGCATAASLAARGWQVTPPSDQQLAQEASGTPRVRSTSSCRHGTVLSNVLAGRPHPPPVQHLQQGHDRTRARLQLAFDAPEAGRQAKLARPSRRTR